MTRFLLAITIAAVCISCKNDQPADLQAANNQPEMTAAPVAKEGFGKVVLHCGSQVLTVEGKCGGNTTSGDMIVAVQDKTVAAKVFTIIFNSKDYPENGKIYTVKKSDFMSETKRPVNEIYLGFSEITPKSQMDWSSDNQSGTMTFQSDGNEIKCAFKDIKLQPSIVYNKGELNQVGIVSGEMTFYKN